MLLAGGMDNERFVTRLAGLPRWKACSDCRFRTGRVMKLKKRRRCPCFHAHQMIESDRKARQHAPVTGEIMRR